LAADRNEHDLLTLEKALAETDGNVSRAAAQAGISRQRAYRLLSSRAVVAAATTPPRTEDDAERAPRI
jgi:transcriptional regulator of acetoin/glycerol metabolism